MQSVNYGKTGLTVSRFGLGCMRFPRDEKESVDMVRYALDHGVNYIDTAYIYGDSEAIVGKALRGGYREKAVLVTKSPIWDVKKQEDFEKYLDIQLKRLGTDVIDVYLLHNLEYNNWVKVKKLDGFTFLDKMIEKGKIRHKAFSFHGPLATFKEIVDSFDWEMAQIQLNILDEFQQAGVEGLKYAASKDMAAVIMEPLRGGNIVTGLPAKAVEIIEKHPEKRRIIEWAFRWLYNMPEVSVVLSGSSSMEQLKDTISIFENAGCNCMSEEDIEMITKVREAFESIQSIGCTGCRYCMPCPKGVSIPDIFRLYNNVKLMSNHWVDREMYARNLLPAGHGADRCIRCGACMKHCPQSIGIPEKLQEAHEELIRVV